MEFHKKWWFWLLITVLVVFIFPKTCGSPEVNERTEHHCVGIPLFASKAIYSNKTYNWCSGVCLAVDAPPVERNETEEEEGPRFITGMISDVEKLILPLVGIFVLIAVIAWIGSMTKKDKTEIRVVKGPNNTLAS
jgi:hypothetical protein